MNDHQRILVFQTAFLGDVILTLPMIQRLHERFPSAAIDVVTTPAAAALLSNHPAISEIIKFDKRKTQKGLRGLLALAIFLRGRSYDLAVVPHRSIRTSFVMALSGVPRKIGFSSVAGFFVYHHRVQRDTTLHESDRNLQLLTPLGMNHSQPVFPDLYPSPQDIRRIDTFLFEREILRPQSLIAVAPGSVWNTKRWPLERFAQLAGMLADAGFEVIIIGGNEDTELGKGITEAAKHKNVHDATGTLTLLQSAELIRRSRAVITNDSAPLHLGVAMRTPVVALFGATVPEFGFAPYGERDTVVETKGLDCRPCAIHGGEKCPIGTFVCMQRIEATAVYDALLRITGPTA